MDFDEEEEEDEQRIKESGGSGKAKATLKTVSFEIKMDHLEILQKRFNERLVETGGFT